ncbi:hypothetical protein LINGRAHAP2_LOCUS13327 [Linum grandiflorum]
MEKHLKTPLCSRFRQ